MQQAYPDYCQLVILKKFVYADFSYSYTEEELEIFRLLSIDKAYNRTVMNELGCMTKNLSMLVDYKFPEKMPVLEFISKENCKIMPTWEKLHWDTLATEGGNSGPRRGALSAF